MDATLNPQSDEQAASMDAQGEKSELMQYFEYQISDTYWAYKDLLKAIFDSDNQA